ncbi:hypothetical protein AB1L06_18420 [Bacillus mojavensis]|uniref:hypothetical protein n=1 Tax=Bacillus mojavensis TaxID=72360 RepID=UPI0039A2E58A
MIDVDWFLSLLDKNDMAYICQKFKLTVTGFQRNLSSAPIKLLGNTIKTALNNGFQKKRGKKKDYLPFEEMFLNIAKDLIEKRPNISEFTFLEFAVHVEFEQDLRNFEIISIAYKLFPKEFEKHYDTIVKNTNKGHYIFNGLSQELSRTPLEKICKIVDVKSLHEKNIETLKEFGNIFLQSSEKVFVEIRDLIADEESAFRFLAKTKKNMHVYIMTAFLLKEERYNEEIYKDLIQTTVLNIQAHKLEQLNKTAEEKEAELKNIESKLLKLTKEKEAELKNVESRLLKLTEEKTRLEKENSSLVTSLNRQIENENHLLGNIKELTKKVDKLESVLNKNEPLQMVFYRIITENNFIIVTKDVDYFVGTPFESVTILPTKFKKNIRSSSQYKEQTVFVTRSSFISATEWYGFKQFLEKHHLSYEELGQYDITFYIQEIIQYLSRKEVLIYADEL